MMGDVDLLEEGIQPLVFATPVGLNGKDFPIEQPLNKTLEFSKILENLGFLP
jgi:hypothetical protein